MYRLYVSPEILAPDYHCRPFAVELGRALVPAVPPGAPSPGRAVHVLFVFAHWLFENVEWFRTLNGPKVLIEHDAYQNQIPESRWCGAWTRLYRQAPFDRIFASGRTTTWRLCEEGLPAEWLPKGFPAEWLSRRPRGTDRVGYFGAWYNAPPNPTWVNVVYRQRVRMAEVLRQQIRIRRLSRTDALQVPYGQFADVVSNYAAVCLNDASMGEPMTKHFECSALGAVPVRDEQSELAELGYREGESMLVYRSWDELVDILRSYQAHPQRWRPLQAAARRAARPHTWAQRAREVRRRLDAQFGAG